MTTNFVEKTNFNVYGVDVEDLKGLQLNVEKLDEYRKAIFEVATQYEYNVVSGKSLGMPSAVGGWNDIMCDPSDGCHPTIEGHKLYARSLCGVLC